MRLAAALAAIATATVVGPSALAARTHLFTASYPGHASATASGKTAAGSVTATGGGPTIGAGNVSGSGSGTLTGKNCFAVDGTGVLRGSAGTIRLSAHHAEMCAVSTTATTVSFAGSAAVTGGTARFARAGGELSFSGTYVQKSGTVKISFRGRISY